MTTPRTKPVALLVDDEPEFVEELRRVFEDLGFDVRTAIDYCDAVAHIKEQAPDFVCMNLSLPRGSGYDVCEFVRSFPACPTALNLVLSERGSPEDIAFAEEAGADAFLPRSVSMDLLRATVVSMLQERSLRAPLKRSTRDLDQPGPA
jgi:DNA-binding response OmpR family regulator